MAKFGYWGEAVVVGLMVVILGLILRQIASYLGLNDNLNTTSTYIMHIFLIGFLIHILSEWMGINRWYCQNGTACTI